QLGWHINDLLTVGEQTAGQVPADSLAPFHRPDTLWPLPHPREHRGIPSGVSGEPPPAEDGLIPSHDFDGGGALVRVHPDDYPAHLVLPVRPCHERRGEGRAPLLRAEQTPLEPLLAHHGARSAQAR